jgi:hypothetical protein
MRHPYGHERRVCQVQEGWTGPQGDFIQNGPASSGHPSPFSLSVVDPKGEEGEGLVGGTEEIFWDCLSDVEG